MAKTIKSKAEIKDMAAYELIREEQLTDLNSVGLVFQHKKTKARIAVISNDDNNKVFSIGFRTPPEDSTGVAHIVEHTVLCGSKEFPAKDPFVELVKGSLNTFLNAMTYPDKTIYPVASCNDKDFQNLMHVYLDAVFYPNIYKKEEIFKQEGWHYELEEEDGELVYNGVVYNEMKGAFSSPEQQLSRLIQQSLFPDTAYGVESGGDPKNIPDLTYENYLDFHKRYYHPSNSYIYLYGDMDIEEKLEWIDEHYLKNFSYAPVDSVIQFQQPFKEMKEVEEYYSVSEEEGIKDQTYLSYNMVIDTSLNKELYVAFQILEYVLIDNPGAPLKQALLDAGIGKDVLSSYDNGIMQPVFSIIAKDANAEQKDKFLQVIRDTLEEIAKNGVDKQALRGAINNFEFKYREADFGSYPKGLMYGIQMLDSWLYDDDKIFCHIMANDTFKFLKEKIGTSYYEDLIRTYLISNSHSAMVMIKPKVNLAQQEEEEIKKKLAEYKAGLSKNEIKQLIEDTKSLWAYQEEPSTEEELEKIPMLTRADMEKKVRPLYNTEKEISGIKVLHHDIYTNGIAYIKIVFDMDKIRELGPYISLLNMVLGYMDTKEHSYLEFANETNIYTGGILADCNTYLQHGKVDSFTATFELRTKVLYENIGKAFALIREMIYETDFSDAKRLREIIAEARSRMQMKINRNGHTMALGRATSYFSEIGKYGDNMEGVGYYRFLCDLEEHFDERREDLIKTFQEILDYVLTKETMIISFVGDKEGYTQFSKEAECFLKDIPSKRKGEKPVADLSTLEHGNNEGLKNAGQVQYVARAGNFMKKGLVYHGALHILKVILGYDYLWNNVRVKGGAYGCMCGFLQSGNAYFVSYRDPGLKETNDIYDQAYEYVQNFEASERDMTKYMIGAISNMDTPLTPSAKGSRSFNAYMSGIDEEYLQNIRNQVLEVTQEDIRSLAPIIRALLDEGSICVIGNDKKIEENKELFDTISAL
ncbi:MAG: insulinase family protein [Lachnospiraceae bacterium]|nr:insulinase family protein [Lachnospiraceae bacterium]